MNQQPDKITALLSKYAAEHGFRNTIFFIDEGYSGTHFQRPGEQKALDRRRRSGKSGTAHI